MKDISVENMLCAIKGLLVNICGKPNVEFNPCDFGDPYTKKTLLWGEFNIPSKNPTEPTEGSKMQFIVPGPRQKELRSITPQGFAKAFFESNK